MKNVTEFEIGMFAMNLIGTLYAQIQRWWTIGSIGNADAVVETHLGCFGIASIGTMLTLTHEGHKIVLKMENQRD